MAPITLYGSPFSLFTGRARSYLIKAKIDYREEPHASSHFYKTVLPKAGGRRGIPTIEFANGDVIRDGVAIIDHFEKLNGHKFSPSSPKQKIVSRLLDVIGAEGLLRPCMHYRFNHDVDEGDFLPFHFGTIYNENTPRGIVSDAKERMAGIREFVLPAWGVTPDTHDLIETFHLETLRVLNEHFAEYPYFLGGKPCIGDFGMMAPLYGHLGRDPKPLSLMTRHAVRLFRWVERMNRPEPDIGEFKNRQESYMEGDLIPSTLKSVLKHLAKDFIPESRAACGQINLWLDENKHLPSGTEVQRSVGSCDFEVLGTMIKAEAQPFRFYLLKRMQDEFEALENQDQKLVKSMLEDTGMTELLDMKLSRSIGRDNNLEVWV